MYPTISSTPNTASARTAMSSLLLSAVITGCMNPTASSSSMVSSQLKFQLIQTEAVSMTVMERKVVCCIYNGDDPVTMKKELTLNSTDGENLNNRVYELSLNLNKSVSSSMLQLRVYDVEDMLNPIIKENVKNNTLIETDF